MTDVAGARTESGILCKMSIAIYWYRSSQQGGRNLYVDLMEISSLYRMTSNIFISQFSLHDKIQWVNIRNKTVPTQ